MTKRFYKLMCFATAAAMSIIGCNNDPSSETDNSMDTLYGIPDTGYDAADAEGMTDEFKDTLYGVEATDFDDSEALPEDDADIDNDEDNFYPDTVYGVDGVDFDDSVDNDTDTTDADIEEENDDYDSFATEYGTPADFDVYPDENFDEDADEDEYADTIMYGDVYTEYDADLANDDDEIIGTDED